MDLRASPKYPKVDDLEITGVSRSGRLRKKPSKLAGFGSLENGSEQQQKQKVLQSPCVPSYDIAGPSGYQPPTTKKKSYFDKREVEAEAESCSSESQSSDSESENAAGPKNQESSATASESEDEDAEASNVPKKQVGFINLELAAQEISSQANSLYMQEKNKKKIVLKGGKIVSGAKTQRKDKGKARFTAYMLWAKDIRQELVQRYPEMDFATISKRLGELWATVPNLEKCNWRRRAKRLIFNTSSTAAVSNECAWKMPAPVAGNKFINRTHTKEKKASKKKLAQQDASTPEKRSSRINQKDKTIINEEQSRAVGVEPIDVAAHLTLLGESLTLIGGLLAEHNGKIAVSGSLSVLLDSLLCALGPLLCLTQQVPEANGADPVTLTKMLDNLAYIMPGL